MKKIFSMVFAVLFMFTLTACTININTDSGKSSEPAVLSSQNQVAQTQGEESVLQNETVLDEAQKEAEKEAKKGEQPVTDSVEENAEIKKPAQSQESSQSSSQSSVDQKPEEPVGSKTESYSESSSKEDTVPSVSADDSSQTSSEADLKLTEDAALDIALKKAGVKKADIHQLEIEYDRDDGVPSYEIEFKSGNTKYKFDIHAETGSVLESETDIEGEKANSSKAASKAEVKLTKDDALDVALGKAGVKKSDIRELEIELDRDDGVVSYEIQFKSGKVEYKYDIHADTGAILEQEKDIDD